MDPEPSRRLDLVKSWAPVGLVFALVLAVYWPALHGGLVWDDDAHVTRAELQSWSGLGRIWTQAHATQQYYPVLHSAFWVEHRLWGEATLGYHLVNVLLHAGACCLLALVLRRLVDRGVGPSASLRAFDSGPVAAGHERRRYAGVEWLAAVLFAVHPVCVESVAWIAEQKNTLSLVFYLLAGLAYLDYERTRRWGSYGGALGLFLLALGTKSVTATLPAALLVVLWWRGGRLEWRRDVVPLVPWFVVGAASGLFTAWVERTLIGAQGADYALSVGSRVQLAGRVIWFYLGKLVWPADLMFIYPRWNVGAAGGGWWGGVLGVVAVTWLLWALRGRARGPLAAWLFFTGSLFPALGFFNVYPFLFSYVADHFQYIAMLGPVTAAAAGLAAVRDHPAAWLRWGSRGLAAIGITALALHAGRESASYRNAATLYRATLLRNPACWMAHNNLAVILAASPATQAEAMDHYREALRLDPDYAEAHNNLAVELSKTPGHENEVIAHCLRALSIHSDYAEAHCNLANVLATMPGHESEVLANYREALRLAPNDARVHYGFANALVKMPGHREEGIAEYEAAIRLSPVYVEAHSNLADELARLPGRQPEALTHYREALRIDPTRAESHYNLSVELAKERGHETEAIAELTAALRLRPNYPKAHNNLGVLYAVQGRFDDARKEWEKTLALDAGNEDAHRNLQRLAQLQKR